MKAVHKNMRVSPQKARLIIDQIRNIHVDKAKQILLFSPKKASRLVLDVLKSSIANACHNFKLNESKLYVKEAFVDKGLVMKRRMPRAKGRSCPILKRTSHVTIKVDVKQER